MAVLAVIFWICMIVWGVDNIQSRQTLRGWIPFICVLILGLATVAFPFLSTHVH